MKRLLITLTLLIILVTGCTEKYSMVEEESGPEVTTTTMEVIEDSGTPEEGSSTSTQPATTSTTVSTAPATTSTLESETPEPDVFAPQVACVPVELSLDDPTLSIQSASELVPVSKTKMLLEYDLTPSGLSDYVVIDREDMFVYYSKSCCNDAAGYDTYVYYVLSVAPGGEWLTFLAVPLEGTYYDYSAIENRYEYYSFRSLPSADLKGNVMIWQECGNTLVLSMGTESRKRGEKFSSASLIERLKARSPAGVSTTTTTQATTTTYGTTVVYSCDELDAGQIRDACYLNVAMSSGDPETCDLIESESAKETCLENTMVEVDGRSTTIEGHVVNASTGAGFKGLKVRAVSKTSGETEASDTTDSSGFYSMDVPSRDTYEITVIYEGKDYTQEIYAKKDYTHEIWFRLG